MPEDSVPESAMRTPGFAAIETRRNECRYYHMDRLAKSLGVALFLATGCGRPADVAPGADAVGAPVEGVSGLPLDRVLADLEAKLDSALAEGSGAASVRRLADAEAMTDRLVETELPFAWLGEGGYSVEARLRQIQAQADRVMALTRGGVDRAALELDVQAFQDRVRSLRQELALGGGPAPEPVEALLRVMDSIRQ